MGQPTGITVKPAGASSFSNVATSITHEPFGPETGLTFGNGITGTYGYDAAYRSTTRTDANGSTNILKHTYAYYNNDSLHTLTDAVTAANTQTLGYDALDRLTSATSGTGGYGTYGWTWDKVSSVTKQTINGTATTFNIATGSNRLMSLVSGSTTTTVDTTANGNIQDTKVGSTTVTSYTYNQANQMASALGSLGSSASYQYGFDGQRLEKASSGTYPILYQYARAASELLAENDLHSGQTADYIYMDPGRNSRPIAEVNPTGGAIYFMHTDRLGTPQTVTNSSKTVVWSATYNPFGDTHSFSGTLTTQSLRLPGQQFDPESANNHNGFRDYAGTLTRYIQSDPIGLTGGMNTYQYVEGNPFKFTDRRGLSPAQNFGQVPGQGSGSSGGGGGLVAKPNYNPFQGTPIAIEDQFADALPGLIKSGFDYVGDYPGTETVSNLWAILCYYVCPATTVTDLAGKLNEESGPISDTQGDPNVVGDQGKNVTSTITQTTTSISRCANSLPCLEKNTPSPR